MRVYWFSWARGAGWMLSVALLLLGGRSSSFGAAKVKSAEVDELFSATNVPHLRIEIPAKSVDRLRGRGWNWGWGATTRERPEVQATLIEGETVYTNVALHLKGSAGSFQPIESKPGFTLNFDKYAKGQRFHGLQKISLNNSVQDPSYSTEKICREIFNAAGVPAPRADYAVVEFNGRKLGLYVLLEGYNRQFLKRHFKNPDGELFDGGFLRDVDSPMAAGAEGDPKRQSDLKPIVFAANAPVATRYEQLSKVLDMDKFITFVATEVLVCHWDGYAMNKNNYRVYYDPESHHVTFMPHGMDQMFGVMMVQATMAVRPAFQGLVAKAVIETPEGRRRYFERLSELNYSLFNVQSITNRIYEFARRIQPVLAGISPSAAGNHEREVADLCERIVQRKESLDEQLAGARGKVLEFNDQGFAPLSGWTSHTNYGTPVLAMVPGPAGKSVFQISAAQGTSVGSWRTKVLLEEGHYSFEARMQTRGVSCDPRDHRAGAGLRVANQSSDNKVAGDSDWKEVAFEFDVPDGIHDVELVCELRAARGEASFDPDSLKLLRK